MSDLDAMARRVIDGNLYMTLATLDPDGAPWLSPVYFTPARYTDFYWVSSPEAHHSRNLLERPEVQIVIFDSSVAVGHAEAVYMAARARAIPDEELDAVLGEAFGGRGGASRGKLDRRRRPAPLRRARPPARCSSAAATRATAAAPTRACPPTRAPCG